MNLTSKQRAYIRSQSNQLKASFQIGALELHDSNIRAIEEAFNNKEILKVKVNRQDKNDKNIMREIANEIESKTKINVVAIIGTTILLYKQHKDRDKRMKIEK